ncbi:MAG TPA: radical SAM protein [Patescibacteria group bacterium]|nr:radical SAM protein [Patescibacteria group bacterium]
MHALNRKTTGLCNVCCRKAPARIYEEGGRVLIRKACPRHGTSVGLVEKDPVFYRWFAGIPLRKPLHFTIMFLPVTHRCNVRCAYCFTGSSRTSDTAFDEIRQAVKDFKGESVELSGGEPTLRQDLPRIIRAVKASGKQAVLETNGLRLADERYVRSLKRAGLGQVLFSFDSLKSAFYEKLSGNRNILAAKKKALLNLARQRVATILSVTVYRGLNDRELNDLLMFAMRRTHFISQIRFRSCVPARGLAKSAPAGYAFSELFDLFARQAHIDRQQLKTDFLRSRLGRSVIFCLRGRIKEKKFIPASGVGAGAAKKLEVKIVSWPTVENIDLRDVKTSMACLTPAKKLLNFFIHNAKAAR